MKKYCLIAVLLFFLTDNSYAQLPDFHLAAGLGASYSGENYSKETGKDNLVIGNATSLEYYLFADATYAEITIGLSDYTFSALGMKKKAPQEIEPVSVLRTNMMNFYITLLLKYPFEFNRVSVFPLAGIDFYGLSDNYGVFGVGADFMVYAGLFIRASIFYSALFGDDAFGGDKTIMSNRMTAKMALGWRFF